MQGVWQSHRPDASRPFWQGPSRTAHHCAAIGESAKAGSIELDEDDFVHDPRVLELIGAEVAKHTASLLKCVSIRKFALLREDFTTDNWMLAPTLQLKRNKVWYQFGDEVEKLYS